MNPLPSGVRVWLAAGVTDMRRGMDSLAAQVQTTLEHNPFSGHVFVFRGRRGDLVKLLWWSGDGMNNRTTRNPQYSFRDSCSSLPLASVARQSCHRTQGHWCEIFDRLLVRA